MKRRHFLQAVSAASLAPAAPSAAVARGASAAPMITDYMLSVASFEAQMSGQVTPAALSKALSLGPDAARALQTRLVKEGLLSAPEAGGLARLSDPFANTRPSPLKRLRQWIDQIAEAADLSAKPELVEQPGEDGAIAIGEPGETRPEQRGL